jgi:hypothetical protein
VLLFRAISFGTFFSYGGRNDQDLPSLVEILDRIIHDAVKRTGIDGFMIDWFYQPPRPKDVPRLESEVQRYEELMGARFPERRRCAKTITRITMHTAVRPSPPAGM